MKQRVRSLAARAVQRMSSASGAVFTTAEG